MNFTCTIASIDHVLYHGSAVSITAPAEEGEVTILPNHTPLVSKVKPGEIIVRSKDSEERFSVTHGVLEVFAGGVTVLIS